jgi:mRNA interferase MazF
MKKPTRGQPSGRKSSDRPYCPDVGDFVWINLDPQSGREQAGRRPALVLTSRRYNEAAGLCVICPITSRMKGYPFEVPLAASGAIKGVALADHMKSLCWETRDVQFAGRADPNDLADAKAKVAALLEIGLTD